MRVDYNIYIVKIACCLQLNCRYMYVPNDLNNSMTRSRLFKSAFLLLQPKTNIKSLKSSNALDPSKSHD